MRIAVIDDDMITQKMVSHVLEKAGHKVIRFDVPPTSPREVLETAPELVITDWQMPAMSGIELCRSLRTDGPNDLRILMLTSHDDDARRQEAISAGADGYVTKPFRPQSLMRAVEAIHATV